MKRLSFASRSAVLLVLLAASAAGIAWGAPGDRPEATPTVPRVMAYEGYLVDANGAPLRDGKYDFTFALYAEPSGGSPVWAEEHRGVTVGGGVLRVLLGKGSAASPLAIPFDRPYWLGIRIGRDPEAAPRMELVTNAYSFRAAVADEVRDGAITTERIAPLAVTDDKIASVSWSKIVGAPGGDGEAQAVKTNDRPGPVPANVWSTRGNTRTNPPYDYLGTADSTDLLFKTNARERMRIYSYGKIVMKGDLDVEGYVTSRKTPNEGGFLLADPQHGLKRFGNDDVRLFTTGGNILLEGGNVGVNVPSPTARLHVGSVPGVTPPFKISDGATDRFVVEHSGRVTIESSVNTDNTVATGYPLYVSGPSNGIAVKVNSSDASSANNFISFFDNSGMVGRIEGQIWSDVLTDPQYDLLTAIDVLEIAVAGIELAGAASSANACAGLGVVACPPIPSLIVAATASLAAQVGRSAITQGFFWDNLGVSYQSGAGDYAEWLERIDENESIGWGDVVGVFGGKITKETKGAEQLLAVSRAPIVLGNMPAKDREERCEKVAFMGQVPVKVVGPVREGDYIIPSGLADGAGIAVPPAMMTPEEYAKAIGRAWGASPDPLVKYVNVAIGLNASDVAKAVGKLQADVEALRAEVRALNARAAAGR